MYNIPTPEELRLFMQNNKLTGADIAALTGVNPRTARRWIQPSEQKGAKKILWAEWALILLLLKKMNIETLLTTLEKWKAEKTGRKLFERSNAGRPVKEAQGETKN